MKLFSFSAVIKMLVRTIKFACLIVWLGGFCQFSMSLKDHTEGQACSKVLSQTRGSLVRK